MWEKTINIGFFLKLHHFEEGMQFAEESLPNGELIVTLNNDKLCYHILMSVMNHQIIPNS